ncbi:hypothetical protein LCGC14_1166930 [marine sediment metagenome]|uniref:Uncharacterized protein n=1 Tax=marine sediment metagenome TaxID=412755 RepID=A0A0F9MDX5_9ZZZZ
MGISKLEGKEKPEELVQAQLLIDDAKVDEALQILRSFEEKRDHTLQNIVYYHLLKCELLRQQGLLENVIKLAEKTYNESLGLGKNLLSVDALLLMAGALLRLNRSDLAFDKIKQGEALLKTLNQELLADNKQRKADVAYIKGLFYDYKSDTNQALEHHEQSLTLREEIGFKPKIGQSLLQIARIIGVSKGELDRALKYAERSLTFFEESNKKWWIAHSLLVMAVLYFYKGEVDRCVVFHERCLVIYKDLNNKYGMAGVLNSMGETYRMKGDLDRALECLEQGLALYQEVGNLHDLARIHDCLIQILIDKGDLERAKQHFYDLEQLNNQLKVKDINLIYLFNKALLLKTSHRVRNLAKAEEILMQILDDMNLDLGLVMKPFTILALLNLCEVLLIELHMTGDLEVLEEIESFVAQLLDIAEKSNSYWILCETHLLQAKLALIQLDLEDAKQLFTEAQYIAEEHGLNLLARKISSEHDKLLDQLRVWESFKKDDTPMADRIKLASIDGVIDRMQGKRAVDPPDVIDEQSTLLLIISEGGILTFSHPFTDEWKRDDELFSSFLSAFTAFSNEFFTKGLDRAKFGDDLILMQSVGPFSICYLFKGQTYPATQRLTQFTEQIQKTTSIWQTLETYYKTSQVLELKDNPSLDSLITEIFIDKT